MKLIFVMSIYKFITTKAKIKQKLQITDAVTMAMRNKLNWADHIMERKDYRWTTKITIWCRNC